MAILKNAEIWFAKLDPKYPNSRMDKNNPTWEVQLRTSNLEQKKEWESYGLKPKLIVGKEGTETEGEPVLTPEGKKQWRVNLKRKSLKQDKKTKEMVDNDPVKVVNGHLEDIAGNTVGNGSKGNIRIYQYEYDKADGTKALASVLMSIQVTKHVVYESKAREDFEMTETETVMPEPASTDEEDDIDDAEAAVENPAPSAPKAPTPNVATADTHPEDAF